MARIRLAIKQRQGAAVIMAIMVVFTVSALAYALLETQDGGIRRADGMAKRATAMESARSAVAKAARALANTPASDLGPADADGATLNALDLTGGFSARLVIYDEQGRINLNNLVEKKKPSAIDIGIFINLLKNMELSAELADTLTDWIDPDSERRRPGGAEDEYYLGLSPPRLPGNRPLIEPLEAAMAKGFDQDVIKKLLPHITALPKSVPLNVNSATSHALAAVINGLELADAKKLVEERKERPFTDVADFRGRLPQKVVGVREQSISVASDYYRITAESSAGKAWAKVEALVFVDRDKKSYETIWRRSI